MEARREVVLGVMLRMGRWAGEAGGGGFLMGVDAAICVADVVARGHSLGWVVDSAPLRIVVGARVGVWKRNGRVMDHASLSYE